MMGKPILTIVFTDNQWDAFVSVILSLENFPPYILSYNNKNKYLGKYLAVWETTARQRRVEISGGE
jgi:hypothetical protein